LIIFVTIQETISLVAALSYSAAHRELTMKRLAFAIGVMTLGFIALGLAPATPARADYAVVQLDDGWCKIWWENGAPPWGTGWTKIAIGLPDWLGASAALDTARSQGECR
jgi:hypothetical protein